MPRVVAIVQARMSSQRLPGKVMMDLNGEPVIRWIYQRLSTSQYLHSILFAIPDGDADNVLYKYLTRLGASVMRGSEKDVLERYYDAAKYCEAEYIVRVCADNPCVCGKEVDRLIRHYMQQRPDYAYNHIPRDNDYPDGLGAEIVSFDVLKRIFFDAEKSYQREHIFSYIWDNPQMFQISTCSPTDPLLKAPWLKLDVDTKQDYERLRALPITITSPTSAIIKSAHEAWERDEKAKRPHS